MDRDEFMELVYETFADEPDNVLANGIIEAADAYAEHEKEQLSKQCTTSDLISRQAVINAIENTNAKMSMPEWDEITNAVMSLPTVQPKPHEGEWINTNPEYKNGFYNNSYYCSECHDYYTTSPYEMKFCPNCGVRMKGASE